MCGLSPFGDEGGGVGPDLTNLAKRSDYKSILESTIHPNMVVSNQFEQHEITLKDGSFVMGKIVSMRRIIIRWFNPGWIPSI